MAYIESFFYYWLLVIIGGVIIYAFLLLVGGIIRGILKLKKSKNLKLLSFLSINKSLKIFVILYLMSFAFFYIDKANEYLWKDRAYKEAKSYAIAGDYIFLWKILLLQFTYPDNQIIKPLQVIHKSILEKMYKYIPEADGERDIWRYKYDLFDYARTMYAPLSDYSIKEKIKFTNPAASFSPRLIPILDSMYIEMDNLNKKPIKDKEFDRFDRYFASISVAPYFYEYAENYVSVNTEKYLEPLEWRKRNPNELDTWQKWDKLYQNPQLKAKFVHYLLMLDVIHEKIKKDKELSKRLEEQPNTKAAFYWGTILGNGRFEFLQTKIDNVYPCDNSNFKKTIEYYKEFTTWAYMTPDSSYRSLSKKEQKNYDFIIEDCNDELYYVAKYICKISFDHISSVEKSIPKEYRTVNFIDLMEGSEGVKKIREIEQKLKKGEINVR